MGAAAWNAIRTHAIASEANAIKQVHVALAPDVTRFVATVKEANRLHGQLDTEAQAAGFTASSPCTKVF